MFRVRAMPASDDGSVLPYSLSPQKQLMIRPRDHFKCHGASNGNTITKGDKLAFQTRQVTLQSVPAIVCLPISVPEDSTITQLILARQTYLCRKVCRRPRVETSFAPLVPSRCTSVSRCGSVRVDLVLLELLVERFDIVAHVRELRDERDQRIDEVHSLNCLVVALVQELVVDLVSFKRHALFGRCISAL